MPPSVDPTLRGQLRQAVERAWAAAIASGALPALGTGDEAPAGRGRAAGQPGARRPRDQPRDEARPAATAGRRSRSPRRSPTSSSREAAATRRSTPVALGRRRRARVRQPPARRTRRSQATIDGDPRRPGDLGPGAAPRRPRASTSSSCRPTRPARCTIGNARGAFVGDLLCRVLEAGGQRVTREYYFNDFGRPGRQARGVGAGDPARASRVPEDGYRGDYVAELAATIPDDDLGGGRRRPAPTPRLDRRALGVGAGPGRDRGAASRTSASTSTSGRARARSTTRAGSSGRSSGCGPAATSTSRTARSGSARPTSATTRTGSSSARTASRPTSRPTSATSPRSSAAASTSSSTSGAPTTTGRWPGSGTPPRRWATTAAAVQMLLIAWVRFVRDGVEVSMSKRAGEFITLDELLAEIGVDAARWFFALTRRRRSAIDFDIELAKKQSTENPVYYVQYAHARIASILRKAAEAGLAPATSIVGRAARRRAGGGPRPRGAPPPGGRRGRGRGRGDAGRHGLRDGARDARSTRSTATRGSSTRPSRSGRPARLALVAGDADDAGERARPARDLGARADVGRLSRPAPSAHARGR